MQSPHGLDPIVLLEDNANDAFFVARALDKARITNPLLVFRSVDEAREYVSTPQVNGHSPVLFVLDMHLAGGGTGIEFLTWLRAQAAPLGTTPAMMLTGSDQAADQDVSLRLGAAAYLQKPVTEERLTNAVQSLGYVIVTNLSAGRVGFRIIERR